MANEPSKEIKKVEEGTKNVVELQKKLKAQIEQSAKAHEQAQAAMLSYTNTSFKQIEQLAQSVGRLNVDMVKLHQLSKEGFENLVKQNKEELEANAKKFEALAKDAAKRKEQLEMYEKRKELILEESVLEKAKVEQEYMLLESSIKNNEDYGVRVLQLHKEKQEKIGAIDKETAEKTSQNAADMEMVLSQHGKNAIDKVIEHSGEVVQHTGYFWRGVLDLNAQKKHINDVKKQYNEYLDGLKEYGDERRQEYDKQIKSALDSYDVDKVSQLAGEREAFETKHNKFLADEEKRIKGEGGELAKIEKAGQALRLEQWKNYAENAEKMTKSLSEKTKMGADAIGKIFKQQADMYKDQVARIDEELKKNETKKYEDLEEYNANKDEYDQRNLELQTAINYEKAILDQATTDEERKQSEERIKNLEGEIFDTNTIGREFTAKEEELKNEKRKAEEQQKKAERNQKRVDLGQKIVEAVADVAGGVAKAIGLGPFIGPIMAAIVGAAGAVQVGIMTKQLAKLEDGGLLSGKRHSQGGMRILGSNIEVEGGEYVVNRKTTQKNLGLMDYINSQDRALTPSDINSYFNQPFAAPSFAPSPFAEMMQPMPVPSLPMKDNADVERLLAGMQQIKLESRVSVTDINTVQENMVKVDEWVGL